MRGGGCWDRPVGGAPNGGGTAAPVTGGAPSGGGAAVGALWSGSVGVSGGGFVDLRRSCEISMRPILMPLLMCLYA